MRRGLTLCLLALSACSDVSSGPPLGSRASAWTTLGEAVPLDTAVYDAPAQGFEAAVASSSSQHLAVWRADSDVSGWGRISAAFVDADGNPLGKAPLEIAAQAGAWPRVSWDGTSFIVIWQSMAPSGGSMSIAMQRISPAGVLLHPAPVVLVPTETSFRSTSLASGPSGSLLVWMAPSAGTTSARAARLDASGVLLDPGGFTLGNAYGNTAVTWDGARWVVVFGTSVRAARVTPGGTVLDPGGVALQSGVISEEPRVAVAGGTTLVAWTAMNQGGEGGWASAGARAVRLGPALEQLDAKPLEVSLTGTLRSVLGMGDDFWLAEQQRVTRLDSSGAVAGVIAQSAELGCALATSGSSSALCVAATPTCVRAAKVSGKLGQDLDAVAKNVSLKPNAQRAPALATDGAGAGLLVWHDDRDGSPGLYARPLTKEGVSPAASSILLAKFVGAEPSPAVASAGNDFFVAWSRNEGTDRRIEARFVGTDQTWLVTDWDVHAPAVACVGTRCLVAWTDGFTVQAARVDPTGVLDPQGIALASYPAKPQTWAVDVLAMKGRFVVVWRGGSAVIGLDGTVEKLWATGSTGIPYWHFGAATQGNVALGAWTVVPESATADAGVGNSTRAVLLGPEGEHLSLEVELDIDTSAAAPGTAPAVGWDGEHFVVVVHGRAYRVGIDGKVVDPPGHVQLEDQGAARFGSLTQGVSLFVGQKTEPTLDVERIWVQKVAGKAPATPDAGADAEPDAAGASSDGSALPAPDLAPVGGCGCRSSQPRSGTPWALVGCLVAFSWRRRHFTPSGTRRSHDGRAVNSAEPHLLVQLRTIALLGLAGRPQPPGRGAKLTRRFSTTRPLRSSPSTSS